MKEKKLIEMACTGNQGRSPVAELVAQNHLDKIGAEYGAISSGTLVDAILKGGVPQGLKVQIVNGAEQRGLYSPTDSELISKSEQDEKILSYLYDKAVTIFGEEERQYRKEVLPIFGIDGMIKKSRDQTIARPDTIAVLSMDKANRDRIQKIHETTQYNPIIDVLGIFATENPTAEVPNAFGKDKKEYIAGIERIVEYVPLAVDKLIK